MGQTLKRSSKRLYLQIYNKINDMICNGEFKPGQRLPPERALAERFDVSRPPVREAIIALEVMGLVEVRPGSGVYVQDSAGDESRKQPALPQDLPGPFEILEARMYFESEACALAAARISNSELQTLATLLASLEKHNAASDAAAAEAVDRQFHQLIADASRNSAIGSTIDWLWGLRDRSEISARFHEALCEQGSKPTIEDHRDILSALMERNAEKARDAMQQHLKRVIDSLIATQIE
jgi:GntR family transcriptional repressor for pyruvate dehydrogenase complex